MSEQLHEDVVDLQMRLAFQEQTIEELDLVVTKQQKQIDHLVHVIDELKQRVERQELKSEEAEEPFDPMLERPPHY